MLPMIMWAALKPLLIKYIIKQGGINALLMVGDLIVKTTKTKADDKMWEEVRPEIEKFK